MVEAIVAGGVSLFIAACSGVVSIHLRSHNRMNEIDGRIDGLELRVTEKYVPREELSVALQRVEDHMIRIENKLDQIVLRNG